MYIILIIFFVSLIGISAMIGKKLILLKKGQIENTEKNLFEIPNLDQIKHVTVKNSKKYGYIILVEIMRFYIRFLKLLKLKYKEIKNVYNKYLPHKEINTQTKEVSKFLKMISDYKYKIKNIKDKIEEEENNY